MCSFHFRKNYIEFSVISFSCGPLFGLKTLPQKLTQNIKKAKIRKPNVSQRKRNVLPCLNTPYIIQRHKS